MLKSELLIYRYSGDTIVPRRLPINSATIADANQLIDIFTAQVLSPQKELAALLRAQVFATAAQTVPLPQNRNQTIATVAALLGEQLNREVLSSEVEAGLYADLTFVGIFCSRERSLEAAISQD